MSLSAIINAAMVDASTQMTTQVLHTAIARLAEKYGFDTAEAIQFINLAPAQPVLLKKKDLPWCGVVDPQCCHALSFRSGLYTQCHKAHVTDNLCGACSKQKQETGSLKNGTVEDRLASSPFEFLGGKVARFSKLMEKNGWTQEFVERSAMAYGVSIPSENFVESKPKRGRKVTRPVMTTPEPQAFEQSPAPVEHSDAESNDGSNAAIPATSEAAPSETVDSSQEVSSPTEVTVYNATDPDSDEELEEQAVPIAKKVDEPKKKGRPPSPKAEGGGEEKPKKKAPKVTETKVDASEAEPSKEKVKKPTVDYSKITAEEAALMKPMALRTACSQHGIDIGSKTAETLRAELISKVSA
jgi:hypothetical protein